MTTESKKTYNLNDIDRLLKKPYSELTEDELEAVIDYKATVKAHDIEIEEKLKAIKQNNEDALKQAKEISDTSAARLDKMVQASIERLNRANKLGGD